LGDDGKFVSLKDGRKVKIRQYRPSDKEGVVSMYEGLSKESLRWSMPPYNRERIERMTSDLENRIIVLGFDGQRAVGHLQVMLATNARFRGTGELFIYLHQDFQNVGLGAALLSEGIALARTRGMHRVELTVVADNQRAIRLYEKVGFQREGLKRENYLGEDGKYHDEVQMGILL
jgi:RimJ/RimL family protein N-acetyltransferase